MKILKLKNLLFGLIALLAIAITMTSCEQDPLENITEATLQEINTEQKRTDIQFDEVQKSEDYIEGQFYVKLKDDYNKNFKSTTSRDVDIAQLPFLNNLKSKHSFEVKSTFHFAKSPKLNRTLRVYLDDAKQSDTFMDELKKNKEVEYVERVPANRTSFTPNDLGTNTNAGQWGLHQINAQAAWDITRGNNNIIVAVVDDAVMTTHPDLVGKTVAGRDVSDNDNNTNPSTDIGHGTHVAGIVGARTNNQNGVASIGYNVSIMPVKSTPDYETSGFILDAYEGVTWAANNGADVINMSWGGGGFSQTNANVISAAAARGAVLVAAAGNSNSSQTHYPSGYPNVISVAATNISDDKASFSNFGSTVDIAAPGASIRSTVISGGYANWNGTSMASPMVAGLCGLILSVDPSLTPAEVENCIKSTADPLNSSFALGAGRINALRAVECAVGNGAVNSLSWNSTPASIANGNNQVSVDYSINQNGLVLVQVYSPSWQLIGQAYQYVSSGSAQLNLSLSVNDPSPTGNHLLAKLLNSAWSDIGVTDLYKSLPGDTPPPPPSDCEVLTNGSFDSNLSNWESWNCTAYASNGVANITSIGAGADPWNAGLLQRNLTIEQGKTYTVTFRARASNNRSITYKAGLSAAPWTSYFYETANLSTSMQTYTHTFTMNYATNTNANFEFFVGTNSSNVYIEDVSLEEANCGTTTTCEILTNGNFNTDVSGWESWSCNAYASGEEAVITGITTGADPWDAGLKQVGFTVEQGKTYNVTFQARAASNRSIIVKSGISYSPWTSYFYETINLTTSMQTYTTTFTMNYATDTNSRFEFFVGTDSPNVYIDSVSMTTDCD